MAEDRRGVLKIITGVIGGGTAVAVAVPVVRALITPISKDTVRGADGFVPVASVDALPVDGTPFQVPVIVQAPRDAYNVLPPTQVGAVFLRRGPKGEVVAFSTVCPHLGCGVDYKAAEQTFACPCHESSFALDGAVGAGPSPRPLDKLETRVSNGTIEVRYRLFKTGTSDKVVV